MELNWMVAAQPTVICNDMKQPLLILIHGFGGNPDEVAPLAEFLSRKGYRTISPGLKGHTGLRNDLKGITYRDWIQSVENELLKAGRELTESILIGFSMGGLIAVNVAVRHRVAAVITINTPIYYWDLKRIWQNLRNDFQTRKFENLKRYLNSSAALPLEAMLNFRRLLNQTKPLLGEVTCPFYVLQGSDDDTVRPRSANYLYDHTGSAVKRISFFDHFGHAMLHGNAAVAAIESIDRFIEALSQRDPQ
jgi:carboxylesterase